MERFTVSIFQVNELDISHKDGSEMGQGEILLAHVMQHLGMKKAMSDLALR